MNRYIPSPEVRAWIYGVLAAAAPLAVVYGLLTEQEVALWLGVISAALGNGLALLNVPLKKEEV